MECEYFAYGVLCSEYAYVDEVTNECTFCGDYCMRCMHGDGHCTECQDDTDDYYFFVSEENPQTCGYAFYNDCGDNEYYTASTKSCNPCGEHCQYCYDESGECYSCKPMDDLGYYAL